MKPTGILATRAAAILREQAAAASKSNGPMAASILLAHALQLDRAPTMGTLADVARAIRATLARFAGQEARYPVVAIWTAALAVVAAPRRLALPGGVCTFAPERLRAFHEAGAAALRAMPMEARRQKARKAVETKLRRGTLNRGDRHPMRKICAADARTIRRTWATWEAERSPAERAKKQTKGPRSKRALAEAHGLSRETVSKILLGKLWAEPKRAGR